MSALCIDICGLSFVSSRWGFAGLLFNVFTPTRNKSRTQAHMAYDEHTDALKTLA